MQMKQGALASAAQVELDLQKAQAALQNEVSYSRSCLVTAPHAVAVILGDGMMYIVTSNHLLPVT